MAKGMTIGFKCDDKEVMIECPLQREKNFIVVSTNILVEDGTLTHIRKVLEIEGGKKLK